MILKIPWRFKPLCVQGLILAFNVLWMWISEYIGPDKLNVPTPWHQSPLVWDHHPHQLFKILKQGGHTQPSHWNPSLASAKCQTTSTPGENNSRFQCCSSTSPFWASGSLQELCWGCGQQEEVQRHPQGKKYKLCPAETCAVPLTIPPKGGAH